MGIIDSILGLFGTAAPDFARIPPDDIDAYWLADHEIDQAEREGQQQLQAVFAKYGLRNEDHWESVKGAICLRHQGNPDFSFGATRVQMRVQLDEMKSQYAFPAGYLEPVEGVGLDRFALIKASVQQAQAFGPSAVAAVLAKFDLDPASYARIDNVWQSRMGGQADAMAASILNGMFHTMLLQSQSYVQSQGVM